MGVKIFDRESPQSGNIGGVFTTLDFYHNLTEAAWCRAMDGARATLGLGFSVSTCGDKGPRLRRDCRGVI